YDVSPLLRVYLATAALKKTSVAAFIERRSRWSATSDASGVWKPLLKTSSPDKMAERTHLAFNRYFKPAEARPLSVAPGRVEGELSKMPRPMDGLYMASTIGWVAGALELAGARDAFVTFDQIQADGELRGVPLVKARFVATWKA